MGPHRVGRDAALTAASGASADAAIDEVFAHFRPPFDLTSDMLLALALCPTPPLRRTFPSVPFLSLWGRTPLVIWFAQITEACYHDAAGRRRSATETGEVPYNELNVLALLNRWAVFVPAIYATSRLSVQIGLGYGMPKRLIEMDVRRAGRQLTARTTHGPRASGVHAHLTGPGRTLGAVFSRWWPRQTWPIRFPSGSEMRALIQDTPRLQIARLRHGRLAIDAPWLPEPVPLMPLGLYLPWLRMCLPPPPPPGR